MRRHTQRGFTLIELLLVLAILGVIVSGAVPAFDRYRRKASVRAAAGELRAIFHLGRSRAIARGLNTGVKFLLIDGMWHYALFDDEDGDGVRNDDIASGVDTMVGEPTPVMEHARLARIGLPPRVIVDPDGDRLSPSRSPVQFNRSAICSFSPLGQSTPGTIYLTDDASDVWCVRVFGGSAKVRVLRYDATWQRWRS